MEIRSLCRGETGARHQPLDDALGLEETGPESGEVPTGGFHGTGEHAAYPVLLTNAHEPVGVLLTGIPRHPETERSLFPVFWHRIGREYAANLEQPDAARPEGLVAGSGI